MNPKNKVKKAPTQPGVYLMKSKEDRIIYVGKAKNLRNRLKSYFQSKDHTARIQTMVNRIVNIQWIITGSELEALMLECTLIKKHKPRYNIHLRDDKTYPYIRITTQEKWPQISIVRKPKRDEAQYFGPYTSAYSIRETLRLLTKVFAVRDCSKAKFSNRSRPCISYDIGICAAPCVDYISEQAYRKIVTDLIHFLKGKNKKILQVFAKKMKRLSSETKYEEAARIRDRLLAIEGLLEKQKMVSLKKNDQDVIGFYQVGKHVEVTVLFVRAGRLLGKKSFGLSIPGGQLSPSKGNLSSPKGKLSSPKGKLSSPKGKLSSPKGKLSSPGLTGGSIPPFLDSFLNQYYDQEFVPDEVITSVDPEGKKLLEAYLKEKKKSAVKITVAKKGEKKSLVDMAIENAKETIRGKNLELKGADVLEALAAKLHLENDPHRIECYDISNIQGNQAVGSRVTFIEGEEDKSLYRKYKIKTVEGPNDFAMMYEVLSRRFRGKAKDTLPDLLMIDGGKGQLSIALRVLKELEIENMDVIGLAKEKVHASFKGKLIEKKQERVYKPGQKNPIVLKENTPVLHLLQRVRDEAHRFAITYHKKLRAKEFIPK